MDSQIKKAFEESKYGDKEERYEAYLYLLKVTESKVDWAYEVWDQLIEDLTHKDNHQRSRAAQYITRLAKSDPEERMPQDFPKIWKVTYDEKFVTARHTLQSLWHVGIAGAKQKDLVMSHLKDRFVNGIDEKHYTLIRSDVLKNRSEEHTSE